MTAPPPPHQTPDADLARLSAEGLVAVIRHGITQALGALRLDAMVDEGGAPYGTTVVALKALADADVALARLAAPPEPPPGWRIMPEVPTEEMIAAGWIDKEDVDPDDIYRAMLAAAPPAPGPGQDGARINDLFNRLHIKDMVHEWCAAAGWQKSLVDGLVRVLRLRMARASSVLSGHKSYGAPDPAPTPPRAGGQENGLTQAAQDVLAERRRQVEVEGWAPWHDDTHKRGEIAVAAGCYAVCAALSARGPASRERGQEFIRQWWPWHFSWWKPGTVRRMLVKAGALILAEIERLDREPHPTEKAED